MRRLISTLVVSLCLILTNCLILPCRALAGDHAATPGTTAARPEAPATVGSSPLQNSGEHSSPLQQGTTAPQQASVPRLIRFNGILQNLAGKAIVGPVDVTFSLYSDEAGGSALWLETQTVQADALGRFTVLLGAMTPAGVPMELFTDSQARWLGVQVSNLPEQPRILLVSVPYALKAGDAETLGGKPASAFMPAVSSGTTAGITTGLATAAGLSALTTTSNKTNPQAVTSSGTANYIAGWAANGTTLGTSVIYQDPTTNRIGIMTNSPAFGLDLNSNIFAVGTKTAAVGQGGTMRFRDDTGTVRWLFGFPGTAGSQDFQMYNYTNGHAPLFIQNGAPSFSFYFSSSGNIGVLTNSPGFPLDVNGNALAVGTKAARAGYGGALRFRDDTGTVRWSLGIPGSAGATDFFVANLATSKQPFYIQAGAPNSALYLSGSGNVGVGTASPAHKLDVAGDINASSNINAGGNLAVTGTISGNGSGLTNLTGANVTGTVPSAAAAANLTCPGCVTTTDLGSAVVTGTNIAGGTITDANISGTAAINPTKIAGTAAVQTGSNNFVGDQMVTGNLTVTADQAIQGNLSLSGTVNGWVIVPYTSSTCTVFGSTSTCISGNVLGGYTGIGGKSNAMSRLVGAKSLKALVGACTAIGANCVEDGLVGATISGGGGEVNGAGYGNRVDNNWGTISGGASNYAGDGHGATSGACCQFVGGGSNNNATGTYAVISGGAYNTSSGVTTAVAGGWSNVASGYIAAVGGGYSNTASGAHATIGGGNTNTASNEASTVAGGQGNSAGGRQSMVAGGYNNSASGDFSFAAGCGASASQSSSFVWDGAGGTANGCNTTLTATAAGQFVADAPSGFWLGNETTNTTATQPAGAFLYTTAGQTAPGNGAYLTTSGVWTSASDRNSKTAFQSFNESRLLATIGQLPITSWQYKVDSASIRHIGPMAQDFYAAFKIGNDDKHISMVDEGGVALAGVQALYRVSLKKDAEIRRARGEIKQLDSRLRGNDAVVATLKRSIEEKDTQIAGMSREIQQLRQAQNRMAEMEARLARLEAVAATARGRETAASATRKPRQAARNEVARVRF